MRVIQVLEEAMTLEQAAQILQGQRAQIGFLGGRILEPSIKCPNYQVQAFHEDCDPEAPMNGWLPDGMRRCVMTMNVARACGMSAHASGQTVAEYLLILIALVGIFAGMVYGLRTGLQRIGNVATGGVTVELAERN